jgi:hypothetical protein
MKIKLLISSLAVAGVLFAAADSTIAGAKDVRVAVAASQGDRDAVAALIKQ